MNKLHAMRVFVQVVELGSFSQAARRMGISAAAATRCVQLLEEDVNARLLDRSTRHVRLTDAGRNYCDGCRAIIVQIEDVDVSLFQAMRADKGLIRIAAPTLFAVTELAPLLRAYRSQNRQIEFDVTTYDGARNLIEGGYDVGFATSRHAVGSTLVSRPLKRFGEWLVAAPAWLAVQPCPHSPQQLRAGDILSVSDDRHALEIDDGDTLHVVNLRPRLLTQSAEVVRSAALAAMGIAVLPECLVTEDVRAGRLVRLLPQCELRDVHEVSLVYPGRHYLTMKVRRFIEFAVARYRSPATAAIAARLDAATPAKSPIHA
ncbi:MULTISPECIES: LysR family transcriptional regulator [unclassified Paraburkholderia]|uniref:LysR family transcriptional regulator n=1 Tax=unclassified Paraburkholderia TaxID=2615204 RepID=UPI002AB249F9|nr:MULTISPECIES: LysR family transcriptional regulator [unclassified Paraburkholderia]